MFGVTKIQSSQPVRRSAFACCSHMFTVPMTVTWANSRSSTPSSSSGPLVVATASSRSNGWLRMAFSPCSRSTLWWTECSRHSRVWWHSR